MATNNQKSFSKKQTTCLNCGQIFTYSTNDYRINKKFCSEKCISAYSEKIQPKRESRQCAYCRKEFISSHPSKKYCSVECAMNASFSHKEIRSEKRKCAFCGKEFAWVSTKPSQKYCSPECRHSATANKPKRQKLRQDPIEALKSEVYLKVSQIINKMDQSKGETFAGKYIDYWEVGRISETTREEVLSRDGHECQVCKRKDSLQLHHLIKRKNGGTHTAENLITLCASCHRHIETGDIDHATQKCLKNAKKYNWGSNEKKEPVDCDILRMLLLALFDKLKDSSVGNDIEIMVQLDEILDIVDNND